MAKRFVNYKLKRLWYKLLYLQGHCNDARKAAAKNYGQVTGDDEREVVQLVLQSMVTMLDELEKLKALLQITDEQSRG